MEQRTQLAINALADRVTSNLREIYGTRDDKHTQAWCDYGYKDTLEFNDYYQMSERFGIASAGVTIPPEICFRTNPKIREGEAAQFEKRSKNTPWETQISKLFRSLKLWRKIKLCDEYQRVGEYGALAIQIKGSVQQADWQKPLQRVTVNNIAKLIPLYQEQLTPVEWENDIQSTRYGEPTMYQFDQSAIGDGRSQDGRNTSVHIHHSRVIIFAEGADDNSIYGRPALKRGFNDLVTMEKIIGAGGEGFWKSAAMKTVYSNTNKDAPQLNQAEIDGMDEAISDFVEGLDKHLMLNGLDPKVLSVAMSDPEMPFQIALQSFSASIGVASKLLVGAQEGRLASAQDGIFTLSNMQSRRESWCSQMIESVIDRFMLYGVIESKEYTIEWDDLLAPSDSDKLNIAEKMSKINKDMAQEVFTTEELRLIAGYQQESAIDEDESEMMEEDDEESAFNAAGHKPPQGVQDAAKKGLELRSKYGRGGTSVGIARARDLSNGASVSTSTINRMVSFFARHEKNRNSEKRESDGGPTNGWIAWQLWGGDAGRSWANSMADRLDD